MPGVMKKRLYELLEDGRESDRAGRWVTRGLIGLIVVNVVVSVLETVAGIRAVYGDVLADLQFATGVVFALEYGLRLYVADLHPPLRRFGPVGGRLRYVLQPTAIIDLLAALPLLLVFVLPGSAFAVVVILRLARFFKLVRYSPALRSLLSAIASEQRALIGSFMIIGGIILFAATLMYLVERDVQPDAFASIPHAMWWAITTATTVGYGDVVPVSVAGKMLAGLVMLLGYAMLALPVGIIASAFAREIHSREFVVTWSMVSRVPLFEDLKAAEIAEVTKLLRAHRVGAGQVIAERGDLAASMYFVASGEIELILPGETLRLGEGGFVGELALLGERRRAATVRASSRVQLLELEADDLRRLMDRNPDLARRILKEAGERTAMGRKEVGDLAEEELQQPGMVEEEGGGSAGEPEPELFAEPAAETGDGPEEVRPTDG
ncbi:Ion transport protein [Polymorphum gilvum SL003B-26A1]|uniref:Ion transport protein n=2 Tax=Polymorphum TaxID=991903 RepID=F2J464_POLGS|nr:Ion transport protein [Polymorphum gilvum SL003B-26A1]